MSEKRETEEIVERETGRLRRLVPDALDVTEKLLRNPRVAPAIKIRVCGMILDKVTAMKNGKGKERPDLARLEETARRIEAIVERLRRETGTPDPL